MGGLGIIPVAQWVKTQQLQSILKMLHSPHPLVQEALVTLLHHTCWTPQPVNFSLCLLFLVNLGEFKTIIYYVNYV